MPPFQLQAKKLRVILDVYPSFSHNLCPTPHQIPSTLSSKYIQALLPPVKKWKVLSHHSQPKNWIKGMKQLFLAIGREAE